jgi:hypothetical protein
MAVFLGLWPLARLVSKYEISAWVPPTILSHSINDLRTSKVSIVVPESQNCPGWFETDLFIPCHDWRDTEVIWLKYYFKLRRSGRYCHINNLRLGPDFSNQRTVLRYPSSRSGFRRNPISNCQHSPDNGWFIWPKLKTMWNMIHSEEEQNVNQTDSKTFNLDRRPINKSDTIR